MAKKKITEPVEKEYRLAVFNNDKDRVLIDYRRLKLELKPDDHVDIFNSLAQIGVCVVIYKKEKIVIVPEDCDLNPNNQYRFTGKEFMALGMGHPRPRQNTNGITKEVAEFHLFKVVKAICEKLEIPFAQECTDWIGDFEYNLKKRYDEQLKKGRRTK